MNKSNLLNSVAELKIRLNRGQGLTYEFKAAATFGMAVKILFEVNLIQTIMITLGIFIAFFIVGVIDLKYLKLYQKEQELRTSKYNPHLNKIKKLTEKFK